MVINQNNSHINSFTKGMNSDQSYDQINETQYTYGKNIRITKNQLIGVTDTNYSSLHEGIVTPVLDGLNINIQDFPYEKILAVDTVDNLGTIIVKNSSNGISVYRFILNETSNKVESFQKIWEDSTITVASDNISTVLYKELENVIKLYIATGTLPIIILRVDDEGLGYLSSQDEYTPVDYLIHNRIIPQDRIYIESIISGRLKTSQVQYTYRYYNKYTSTTQLAPLTNKIQVIDPSRSKDIGNAEDTNTSIGFTLTINTSDFAKYYDRLQIYRLSYIKPGEDAEVALIYDGKYKTNIQSNKFTLNDVGIEPLQTLTIEEFSAMSGLILIPQTIGQNQNYMFCGNVKDDTILKDLSISNLGAITTIEASIKLSDSLDGNIPQPDNSKITNESIKNYLESRGINSSLAADTYNNIITSSMLRSLRRGETYRYGIVFYDKYGRRSDVMTVGDVNVPSINSSDIQSLPFKSENGKLYAKPIGVEIPIPSITGDGSEDIIGCQIVRRSSIDVYQNTLLQVALARPISQGLAEQANDTNPTKYSPFYPTGFLNVNDLYIHPHYYQSLIDASEESTELLNAYTKNTQLFQAFSSEINFRRDDVLSKINTSDAKLQEQFYIGSNFGRFDGTQVQDQFSGLSFVDDKIDINRKTVDKLSANDKQALYYVFNYFDQDDVTSSNFNTEINIKSIKDVKIAEWHEGFSNVIKDTEGNQIYDATKQYKNFNTTIDQYSYNNWVSFGKYDLKPGTLSQVNNGTNDGAGAEVQEFVTYGTNYDVWKTDNGWKGYLRNGFIGPGPSCFLLTTESETGTFPMPKNKFYTSICNITHTPKLDNVQSDENTQYFGFGNYFKLHWNNGKLVTDTGNTNLIVFDGDIYITPHEFTTAYKCYDFNSVDSLQSIQVTNYVPLESKVNTYFDYGMNLANTSSANLLYEPGTIDGVISQERPAHQYNMIYSDNDASNDVFTLISTDKNETNQFKQRAYFSEPKENGEFIDNFPIFKPASFIDVDSKYGQLTNLFTDKNSLFYWQDHAFGKFSVNERSLINDQNGNTIMLGQAGILSRYDYISTKYGMRLYDFCAISTEQAIYWVDINNKAIVAANSNSAVNYGEQVGVQNIINDKISNNIPKVDYDLQNNELLCKCLNSEEQLIFNVKYNFATSIYNRNYMNMAYIKNHLYGLRIKNNKLYIDKHNYLSSKVGGYLKPLVLEYVINPSASITKVFDNQQIIPIKRDSFKNAAQILNKVNMAFETDIVSKTLAKIEPYNDREGNITYAVPRYTVGGGYGNRIRGKWMKVNITNENPIDYFTISHIITKFRQSFS